MRLLVRADADAEVGAGHVARCANLAARMRRRGHQVTFVCSTIPSTLANSLVTRGFDVHRIGPVADWREDARQSLYVAKALGPVDLVIVDHYGLDVQWEEALKSAASRVLVIDDLADRRHSCDFLIDTTPGSGPDRYAALVPVGASTWLGPGYALLREEFDAPGLDRDRAGRVERLLVSLGGGVSGSMLTPLVEALGRMDDPAPEVRILLGYAFPDPAHVHAAAAGVAGVEVIDATEDVLGLMRWADLAIGSCGAAAWERCAVGLPTLAVITAPNQVANAQGLVAAGAVDLLGQMAPLAAADWSRAIDRARSDATHVAAMASAAHAMTVDRRECLARVVDGLEAGAVR